MSLIARKAKKKKDISVTLVGVSEIKNERNNKNKRKKREEKILVFKFE